MSANMSANQETAIVPSQPTISPDEASLGEIIGRTEGMLRAGGTAALSASEAPVCACIRAVAKAYGIKPQGPLQASPEETLAESIERLARGNGLLSRAVSLEGNWERTQSSPLIVTLKECGRPVTLMPKGKRWYLIDTVPGTKKRKFTREDAGNIDLIAFLLSPTLPDGVLKPKQLLMFGFALKKMDLTVFFAMTLMGGVLATLVPIATHVVTSIVVPGRDVEMLIHVGAMLIALLFATAVTKLTASLANLRMDGAVGSILKVAAADRAIRIVLADKSKLPSPATGTLVSRSVEGWHKGVWHQWLTVAGAVVMAVPSLIVMTMTAPIAALLALCLLGTAIGFSVWISKVQLGALFNGPSSQTSWIGASYEALSGIETVRAFNAQSRLFTRFSTSLMDLKARFLRSDRIGTSVKVLEATLEALIVLVGVATVLILHRNLPSSATASFMMALMTVTGAAASTVHALLGAVMLGLQKKIIQVILDGKPAPAIGGARPPQFCGNIRLNDVTFRHDTKGAPILDGISMTISAGEHIGVAGPSGSGKSTLLDILLGIAKPDSGQVFFDGVDLDGLDSSAVRRQIGVVGQSLGLFPGTIFENIATGVPMKQDTIWSALERAAMADDVRAMPLGLSTLISDADAVLSRGQIQRILLARAMAHQPKILILDEATSALDPAAEAHVTRSFAQMHATVVSVAHRLDTLARCDRIYVLKDGRIIESGSYAELIAQGGHFERMVAAEARAQTASPNPVHLAIERLRQEMQSTHQS
jgi:ABC-type bacteriocin/lantibiotic exporter with double-glycine peptidase domain